MFSFYLTKILLIFFANYVHVPLITCALSKLTQTQEKNSRMFVLTQTVLFFHNAYQLVSTTLVCYLSWSLCWGHTIIEVTTTFEEPLYF